MTFSDAIKTCLSKGLAFWGRSPRAQFFKFLPAGIALCGLAGAVAVWQGFTFPGILITVFIAALPLLAVWWRRLQDVGEAGVHAVLPWVSLLYALVCGWAAMKAGAALNVYYPEWRNPVVLLLVFPLGVIGYFGNMFGDIVGQIIAMLIALPLFILFLVRFSFALGQAFLPSQPGPNKYGPNPNEVPS
ncbi:hypothetical protein ACOXXX_13875 [Thalassococcus sp. BH17M4-6]|uniref:hypothetical protein n=1 Tax=Thalassococcus sp. BH17M4-6 TaxID=3413148 RepID=UPI003BDCC0B6